MKRSEVDRSKISPMMAQYLDIKEIWFFEKFLRERFQFENIDIKIKYHESVKKKSIKEEWRNIIAYMSHKYPLTKPMLLLKSDVEENGNNILIKMHIKGADFLKAKKTDKELIKVLENLFGIKYTVELTEEIMTELLTTGKTKNKVAGFTSKAGNIFDSCLKYENGQISFDFDNPGETDPAAESKKAEMQSPGMQSAGVQNSEMQSSGIESPEMNSGSGANNVTDNNTNDTQDIGIPEDFMAGLEIPQEDDQNNISDADMAAAYELFEN